MCKLYLTLLLFLFSFRPCFGLEISFLPQANVLDNSITLADIVIFNQSTELTKSLGTQIISKSPKPGESITFQSANIKKYITRRFHLPVTINWVGSSTVQVKRNGQEIGPNRLLQTIDEYIHTNKASLPDAEIRFVAKSLPLPFIIPEGKLTFEVVPSNPNIIGSSAFSIIIRADGRVRKNLSVKGKVQAFALVAVTTANIKRGSILTPTNTQLIKKDISKLRNPCFNLRNILGKRLTRTARAGSAINTSDVEFPPLVRKGHLVKILISSGTLYVSATGIARMNGKLNQVIRVRNASSQKVIFCRVAAPGIVEVQI